MNEESKAKVTEQAEKSGLPEKKKRALLGYLAILFCAAFILVLMSFLIQLRDSNSTISNLSQTSTTALANAQRLQDDNEALRQQVKELEDALDAAELQLTQQQTEAASTQEALQSAIDEGAAALEAQSAQLEEQQAALTEAAKKQEAAALLMKLLNQKDPADAEKLRAELEKLLRENKELLDENGWALWRSYKLPGTEN